MYNRLNPSDETALKSLRVAQVIIQNRYRNGHYSKIDAVLKEAFGEKGTRAPARKAHSTATQHDSHRTMADSRGDEKSLVLYHEK